MPDPVTWTDEQVADHAHAVHHDPTTHPQPALCAVCALAVERGLHPNDRTDP